MTVHGFALTLISLAFIAKVVSVILIGNLHWSVRIFEVTSTATYFVYIGWLGLMRREFKEENGKYIFYATLLVILDITTYYFLKGWK